MDESRPIFLQIAERLEDEILDRAIDEDAAIPSINELAAFHRINPATALKGVNRLVEQGIVAKRRGVGMFVVPGARERIVERRRAEFAADYLRPLVAEAARLGIGVDELAGMLRGERITS
ncbi:GntR family transcriptional regulator [Agromyces marinus]|uniref:GntR family transcriptional regulator n=1 Tax=Agromyces marinus TaxID=1389020 RepID=A0ABN6YGQ6_9MICO|nr:GntR family transcriptional regulator [Agromyces marinus]UIP59819.1 hypothetical protein DSM26151_27330 [Agromyces marinus]BDZ55097.1 GntR family transcriptional regulator [Agromyces marinus]